MSAYETSARNAATQVVRQLREGGHTAYFAGGCVRDALLGEWPQDYDVATDAKPPRVRELFLRSRFVGEAFGVVLVTMVGDRKPADWQGLQRPTTKDGRWVHQVEVATFRTEWGYADGRRPTGIEFSDAEHDARRRDFTINGLFEDPLAADAQGRIIDFVGGQRDLADGVLRAIGEPDERFGEDYLRLLRAVRFAARLGLRVEPRTAAAVARHAPQLGRISRERIGQEMEAMLTGPRPARCVRLLRRLGLDGPVLDEPVMKAPTPTLVALARLRRREAVEYPTMLAAWLIDRHIPRDAPIADFMEAFVQHTLAAILTGWRAALCLPNEQRDRLKHTLGGLPQALNWPSLPVARRKRLLARTTWPATAQLMHAMAWSPVVSRAADAIAREAGPLVAEGVAPAPLITGDDLVAMGMRPGPHVGRLLETLYDAQLENRIATREQAVAMARQSAE